MSRFISLTAPLLAVTVASALVAAQPADVPEVFTLGTYNTYLLFDDVDDPDTQDEDFQAKPEEALDALGAVIDALNVDVLGLQEIEDANALEQFVRGHIKGEGYAIYHDMPAGNNFNVALLSRFPVVMAERFGDQNDSEGGYRWLRHRMVHFQTEIAPEYTLHAFVVHLKANAEPRSQQMRMEMVIDLIDWMTGELGLDPQNDNIVVMGDMNASADSEPVEKLLQAGFQNLTAEEPNPDYTMSSAQPVGQIDFVFASDAAMHEYVPGTARVGSKPSLGTLQKASDHLPVVAAFVSTDVASAEERDRILESLGDLGRARVDALREMKAPSILMEEMVEQSLAAASESHPMTVAEIRAEAEGLFAKGEQPPVRIAIGQALSEGDKIVRGRTQVAFSDLSGGILLDEAGREHFPDMPQPGDILRVTGRVVEYRDILEFVPVKPVEILGHAIFPLEIPLLEFEELARNGEKYEGGRVRLQARTIDREDHNPGVKFGLAPIAEGDPDVPPVHLWVSRLAFSPNFSVGDEVLIDGVVSQYDGVYQLQVTKPADVKIIGSD